MSKVKGLDVILSIGASQLGGQRNATLNRSSELIDVTNKTSANSWKESLPGYKEWSLDCDGLYVISDTAHTALANAFNNGTAITVSLSGSGVSYTGSAYITDYPIEAPYDDALTYSVSLTGSGALS